MKREAVLAIVLAAVVFAPALLAGQAPSAHPADPFGGVDLVAALKQVPGCLGVEAARTASGKQVLFAWFENKEAVLRWYYSDTHQALMKQFFPESPRGDRTPLAGVPPDRPVLAVASVTMADRAPGGITSLPVSQISIELYTPLPGGLALGGTFAPAALKVPGMMAAPLPATK
jgi:hypothetical protein